MNIVLLSPLFTTVADHTTVSEIEFYAILEYYCSIPDSGELIWGAGGAKQSEFIGYRIVSFYSQEIDVALLIDIYRGGRVAPWSNSEKQVFKDIIRRFNSIRKGNLRWLSRQTRT